MRKRSWTFLLAIVTVAAAVTVYLALKSREMESRIARSATPTYTYRIVKTYPHDRDAFTQGLVLDAGILYEGTGRRGHSTVRRVDVATGEILDVRRLEDRYFGEGIAVVDDRIMQLTFTSHVGFIYDKRDLSVLGKFTYATNGWGLAYDGTNLIMSDGTSQLEFLDPVSYTHLRAHET